MWQIWSAPAERSGDGALDIGQSGSHIILRGNTLSKAPSPLRSAGALQKTGIATLLFRDLSNRDGFVLFLAVDSDRSLARLLVDTNDGGRGKVSVRVNFYFVAGLELGCRARA